MSGNTPTVRASGNLRIRISVQAEKVQFSISGTSMAVYCLAIQPAMAVKVQARSVGVFVGVEQNVCAVVLVITIPSISVR